MNLVRKTILFQGIYFLLTGIWPLLSIESFMAVTGPKTDIWLVKTFSIQICMMGIVLCYGSLSKDFRPHIILLSLLSAAGFIAAEVFYVIRGTIPPVYLADAFVELVIAFLVGSYVLFRKKLENGIS